MTTDMQRAASGRFEQDVREQRMALLWERLADLVTPQPRSVITPHLWRWKEVREVLLEAGRRITAEEAERRVLILENPGAVGESRITTSLYAGLQLVLPGEVAPAHRHSQSALRLVLEGEGGHTVVDGRRLPTVAGDLLVTPPMCWHDHGNDSPSPVIWLDLLDIPLVQHFDASFFEPGTERAQTVLDETVLDDSTTSSSPDGPFLRFDLAGMRDRLEAARAAGEPDPWRGYQLDYPGDRRSSGADGGALLSTMTASLSLLPAGWSSASRRSTDATVYVPLQGEGSTTAGDTVLEWGPRDVFIVPSWAPVRHHADGETLLFACSDRVAQRALGLFREQLGD
jgi:gentisate 1,2-dioxygenase